VEHLLKRNRIYYQKESNALVLLGDGGGGCGGCGGA